MITLQCFPLQSLCCKPKTLPRKQAEMSVKTDYNKVIYNNHKIKSYQVTALSHGNRQILLCSEKLICI